MKWKKNKYRAEPVSIDGHIFASRREANYYKALLLLQKAGEVVNIELQPEFVLIPDFYRNGKKVRGITYKADFRVTYKDGRVEIVDCKGYRTPVYRLKKKLFMWAYPDWEIIEK